MYVHKIVNWIKDREYNTFSPNMNRGTMYKTVWFSIYLLCMLAYEVTTRLWMEVYLHKKEDKCIQNTIDTWLKVYTKKTYSWTILLLIDNTLILFNNEEKGF